MAIGGDNFSKRQGKSTEFKTDVYGFLDECFHDSDEEIVVSTRNKYFAFGAKKFLEDMNFTFLNSEMSDPRLVISLIKNEFKFVDHMEDHVTLNLPYDWDAMEKDVRNYVSANPITKKEKVQVDESAWNSPIESEQEKDLVDGVKDWVREIQRKVNISAADAAEMAKKYIKKAYHDKNTTSYTAKGNPDMKLLSGEYNNIESLINKNGWKEQFELAYNMTVRQYLRNHLNDVDVEKNIISRLGFEYIYDEIVVKEHIYWTNRIIEIRYKDQDQDVEDSNVDSSEFESTHTPELVQGQTSDEVVNNFLADFRDDSTPNEVIEDNSELIKGDDDKYNILKSINTEQPIFFVGTIVNHKNDFSIQSDFASFTLDNGDEQVDVMSDGFVSILTLDEFNKHREFILEGCDNIVCVSNMVGNIEVSVRDHDGNLNSNFDFNDYIYDQFSGDVDAVVKIPTGSNMMEFDEMTVDLVLRQL